VNEDLAALLRARNTLLWIVTREELRVERAIVAAAGVAQYPTRLWDCATGLTDAQGGPIQQGLQDANAMLNTIRGDETRAVYVLRDLHKWFDPVVSRNLKSLARDLQSAERKKARAIIVLTSSSEVPPELAGCTTVIDYPLPAREEIAKVLDDAIAALPPELAAQAAPNGTRDAAIDAAVGLTSEEASNCYAKSLVTTKKIDPAQVSSEKRRVIAREKVLTWYDPDPRGLAAVGGLDKLKEWLSVRRKAFSPAARAYGLPTPKGCLLVGVPGCGKSLTAKAVAAAWSMPLLRLDLGALKSKFVGESEANIRRALAVAETVSPCIVWLDEIEKALAGSTGPQGDGGVSSDALGVVLSWMQERQGSVFVIATANDVRGLPPELLRKGRFDELFFVDLPTHAERVEVLAASIVQLCSGHASDVDVPAVADATQDFTGAELAAIVPDAMFAAFGDGERGIRTDDLLAAAKTVTPLALTAKEKIEELRAWASTRARRASSVADGVARTSGRDIDI